MRSKHVLLLVAMVLYECRSEPVVVRLTTEEVLERLKIAYALEDSGNYLSADSIYRELLTYSVTPADSSSISASYLSVLRKKADFRGMLFHSNRAFPENSAENRDLLRRHSYRMDAFLALRMCDSTRIELVNLVKLVEQDSTLQLKIADLIHNTAVVDSICGATDTIFNSPVNYRATSTTNPQ
jgi:hypothetical protein